MILSIRHNFSVKIELTSVQAATLEAQLHDRNCAPPLFNWKALRDQSKIIQAVLLRYKSPRTVSDLIIRPETLCKQHVSTMLQ